MEIVPRAYGELLADALNRLTRTWRPLVSSALYAFIPAGLVSVVVFRLTGATTFLDLVLNDPGYLQSLDPAAFSRLASPFFRAALVALTLQAVAAIFVYVVSHRLIAADLRGAPITGPEARKIALRRLPTAIAAALVAIAAVAVLLGLGLTVWFIPMTAVGTPTAASLLIAGFLLVVLAAPGTWLAVSLSVVTAVAGLESEGVIGSLRRSARLVRGRWWPTLGFVLLVGLAGSVAVQLIQLVALPIAAVGDAGASLTVVSLLGIVSQGLIVAAMGGMITVWYVDLRARREPLTSGDLP